MQNKEKVAVQATEEELKVPKGFNPSRPLPSHMGPKIRHKKRKFYDGKQTKKPKQKNFKNSRKEKRAKKLTNKIK